MPLFRDRWISLSKCLFNFLTLLHYYARRYYLITLLHSSLPVFLPLPIRYYCITLLHEYLRKLFSPFSTLLPCYAITGAFAKFCEIMRYAHSNVIQAMFVTTLLHYYASMLEANVLFFHFLSYYLVTLLRALLSTLYVCKCHYTTTLLRRYSTDYVLYKWFVFPFF